MHLVVVFDLVFFLASLTALIILFHGWKRALREALDRLAQEMDVIYQDEVGRWVADPWQLRNDYIQVVLGDMEGRTFLAQQADRKLTEEQAKRILTLLEAQYCRQAMYTSCGFFFEDLSRLEPRYVIAYAAKAIHLVNTLCTILIKAGLRLISDYLEVVMSYTLTGDT